MSDRDIIERVAQLLKRPILGPYGPYGINKKQMWYTWTTGSDAIGWMMTLYSFMGDRRKSKIEDIIAIWKTQMRMGKPNADTSIGH